EEAAQGVVEHIEDALGPAAFDRRTVRAEVDRDAVGDEPVSGHPDPESLPYGASPPVAGDHVPCVHAALGTGLDVPRGGEDALGDLREIRQLGEVAKLGAELQRARAQDRLERVLREEEAASRADKLDSGIEAWDVLCDLGARERLDRRDAPVRVVLLLGGAADGVLDARGAEHLEGPQVKVRGARVDRGSSVTLDRERADSVQAEEHRGREADEAAADDQNRHALSCRRAIDAAMHSAASTDWPSPC